MLEKGPGPKTVTVFETSFCKLNWIDVIILQADFHEDSIMRYFPIDHWFRTYFIIGVSISIYQHKYCNIILESCALHLVN